MSLTGWIGVDLDGTLAQYHGWNQDGGVGEPVPAMMERVKRWIAEGRRVKIFTARVCNDEAQHRIVRAWLEKHGIGQLEITHCKDYGMIELWDDRCVQVHRNTGQPYGPSSLDHPSCVVCHGTVYIPLTLVNVAGACCSSGCLAQFDRAKSGV